MTRAALAAILLAVLGAAAGCGFGPGGSGGPVTVSVTRDFGDKNLEPPKSEPAHDGDTVMRLLQRGFEVKTRYGGGFVQEIDGLSGGLEGDRRVDWFYYVNGIEADVGAAQRRVSPGDRIWWDHHDWQGAMRIPAVVGAFPEPFMSGENGRRFPLRLVCLDPEARNCNEVQTRLANADVTEVARSSLEQSVGQQVLRVLVGPWTQVRKDVAARQLEDGPRASGVFARPSPDGRTLTVLDPDGRPAHRFGVGTGLVAATRFEGQQPTWLVTGTDEVGVASAAAALTPDALHDHFALAVNAGRGDPLPVLP